MTETNELFERVARMQKDIEELKSAQEDIFFNERDRYKERVNSCLKGSKNNALVYLQLDGIRSVSEIISDLKRDEKPIPSRTFWDAMDRLIHDGLIEKKGKKGKSLIFNKKKWAKTLRIDDYVRSQFNIE